MSGMNLTLNVNAARIQQLSSQSKYRDKKILQSAVKDLISETVNSLETQNWKKRTSSSNFENKMSNLRILSFEKVTVRMHKIDRMKKQEIQNLGEKALYYWPYHWMSIRIKICSRKKFWWIIKVFVFPEIKWEACLSGMLVSLCVNYKIETLHKSSVM